jgi:hypothetical protein
MAEPKRLLAPTADQKEWSRPLSLSRLTRDVGAGATSGDPNSIRCSVHQVRETGSDFKSEATAAELLMTA